MIKKEDLSMKRKRIQCNNHGQPFKYHCQNPACESPYLCGEVDCIDEHFHDGGRLILTRFDSKLWESKFQQVENVMNNETLKIKEENLSKLIDYFTQTLQKIRQEMTVFQEVKTKIVQDEDNKLNGQYFENINGFLSMGCKLERKIDNLRSKIIDEDIMLEGNRPQHIEIHESQNHTEKQREREYEEEESPKHFKNKLEIEKHTNHHTNQEQNQELQSEQTLKLPRKKHVQYYENPYLTSLLRKQIKKFEWTSFEIIFNAQSQLTTPEKFHEKLKDRKNLLFLFINEQQIIGSFYRQPYPSITDKVRKDPNSFIFIYDETLPDKFAIFYADNQSQSHMSISERLLICQGNTPNNGDGLRTFQRNLESLAFFLPSISFKNPIPNRQVTYNGVLKIKEFYILQQFKE